MYQHPYRIPTIHHRSPHKLGCYIIPMKWERKTWGSIESSWTCFDVELMVSYSRSHTVCCLNIQYTCQLQLESISSTVPQKTRESGGTHARNQMNNNVPTQSHPHLVWQHAQQNFGRPHQILLQGFLEKLSVQWLLYVSAFHSFCSALLLTYTFGSNNLS